MVRYEDLLFRTQDTVAEICACVGGTMTEEFDHVDRAIKWGAGHGGAGLQGSGRVDALRKFASEEKRYELYTARDLDHVRAAVDRRLVDAFDYGFSSSSRGVSRDAECAPDKAASVRRAVYFSDASRRRRGRDADIFRGDGVAAPPRPRRGYSVEPGRRRGFEPDRPRRSDEASLGRALDSAATATRIIRGDGSPPRL